MGKLSSGLISAFSFIDLGINQVPAAFTDAQVDAINEEIRTQA